jgi:hypothetical protein
LDPSMHNSVDPYSQKCGSSSPNFNFVAIVLLLFVRASLQAAFF